MPSMAESIFIVTFAWNTSAHDVDPESDRDLTSVLCNISSVNCGLRSFVMKRLRRSVVESLKILYYIEPKRRILVEA